ncbi:M15 family metallopeptidase [Lolliginicoccus levis]|uniref:M15 family metallopeptidase n=1 Tax=Lolliginicoccus levis TaxID=2919542 RepID=UPI00241CB010|nr:M15 family metallopeptidase [Lolliginicoccus levis]
MRRWQRMRTGMVVASAGLAAVLLPGVAVAQPLATGSAEGTDRLDPLLALAYTLAVADARAEGVVISVTSGARSAEQQQALWEQGLATYGSPDEARRWVLPPDESTHVTGDAVDVGPRDGAAWLQRNGFRYGLCQSFINEWWHFELATFPGTPCPRPLPDASWR